MGIVVAIYSGAQVERLAQGQAVLELPAGTAAEFPLERIHMRELQQAALVGTPVAEHTELCHRGDGAGLVTLAAQSTADHGERQVAAQALRLAGQQGGVALQAALALQPAALDAGGGVPGHVRQRRQRSK